ncbi:MAG TPA: hypothetical protein VNZ55_11540 [Thermomicrobiales bacterium]|nr:hypothetical protein [Thermomicrobiales bacterium]
MELNAHTAVELERPITNLISRSVLRKDGWRLIVPYLPNEHIPLTGAGTRPDWLEMAVQL